MTDVFQPEGQAAEPQGPFFRVLAQYVRDLSFENPRAPDSLRLEGRPDVEMGVEMSARGRPDGLYEVEMRLSVKATSEQAPLFQVELVYGGLFQLSGFSETDLEPIDFATVYAARKAQEGGQLIGNA